MMESVLVDGRAELLIQDCHCISSGNVGAAIRIISGSQLSRIKPKSRFVILLLIEEHFGQATKDYRIKFIGSGQYTVDCLLLFLLILTTQCFNRFIGDLDIDSCV